MRVKYTNILSIKVQFPSILGDFFILIFKFTLNTYSEFVNDKIYEDWV